MSWQPCGSGCSGALIFILMRSPPLICPLRCRPEILMTFFLRFSFFSFFLPVPRRCMLPLYVCVCASSSLGLAFKELFNPRGALMKGRFSHLRPGAWRLSMSGDASPVPPAAGGTGQELIRKQRSLLPWPHPALVAVSGRRGRTGGERQDRAGGAFGLVR